MKRMIALAAALVLASTIAAGAADAPAQFKLTAQNGSGENGTATLAEGAPGSGEIIVTVKMTGAPADVAQPIHIHKGTCAKLDPKPEYPLTTLQGGTSETKLKGVTIADLEKGDYAINVHKSVNDIPAYVSCGNLKLP